jgi:DNA polymerase-1
LLEHRGLTKLKSTYTDKLPQMVNPRTGRVHEFRQATAVTGRLASTDPNLQNIPVRTAEGRRIREAFIAPPGHVLVSADYSQIELRIMAHLSRDASLLEAFAKGADIHRANSAEIFGVTIDEVTPEQRRYIKAVNFGLIYGMSAFGLAAQLGIERGAAQHHRQVFCALSRRGRVHAPRGTGVRLRIRRDGARTPALAARHQRRRRPAADGAERRRSTRRCRERRRI